MTSRLLPTVALVTVCVAYTHALVPGNVYDNLNNLIQGVCRNQGGENCEIDTTGTTDWYRKYFNQQPLKLEPSMSAPVVPLDKQTQQNKTVSQFYCPARDFAYSCRLDKQYFEQTVHSYTHNSGWNFGETTKISATFGISALGVGGGAGPVFQFSFSYSFQDGTASAHTEQETTVESVAIQVPANATKCLLITTKLATVSATGTQNVYINASNYIGTHQGSAHHWSAVDTDPKETHYYRLFSIPYMVQLAKRLGIPEAAAWTISPDGQFASITTTIDHSFNLATVGSTTFNTWYDSTSIDCTRWDPGHALLRAEGPVGQHVTQDGRTLPVYNAVRVG